MPRRQNSFGWGIIIGSVALAASATLAHAQQVRTAPGVKAQVIHLPSGQVPVMHTPTGVVQPTEAPVIVREQFMSAQTAGEEGGIAGVLPNGRCCLTNGTCTITNFPACESLNGVYMGDGTNCAEFDCGQLGRCCINDNFNVSCAFVNLATCFITLGGEYWQPGVTCEASPCAPFGACCRDDGSGGTFCYITAEFLCDAFEGVWQGDNVDCSKVDCSPVGACCTDLGCVIVTESECDGNGTWQGAGSDCSTCVNLSVGACCIDRNECLLATREDCDNIGGVYFGDGSSCFGKSGVSCSDSPQIGACCINKTCHMTTEAICEFFSGNFIGVGEDCFDVDCSNLTGACCINTKCLMTTQENCDFLGGNFFGVGEECIDVDCGELPGACCLNNGLNCEVLLEADCLAQGGTFAGSGTECTSGQGGTCPLFVGKCCLQNANGTSYCLTLNIDQCFATPGSVWWAIPGVCEDPGAPHCPVFGACCLPSGFCQVIDENICVNIFGGVYKGDGTTCADTDLNGQAEVCELIGDTNGDGHVNVADLLGVISHWGPCPAPCPWDIAPAPAGDGTCNVSDLLSVISHWG